MIVCDLLLPLTFWPDGRGLWLTNCLMQDAEMCWICLDMSGELIRPCRCPRCVGDFIFLHYIDSECRMIAVIVGWTDEHCLTEWQLMSGCRVAHRRCLARWQLQSAGTRKEKHCEFCDSQLPDWKEALTPKDAESVHAPAIMNVNFDGRTYSFEVKPGPEGYAMFTEAIRRAFDLPDDSELNITFTCDEPTVPELGSLLTLQGPGAYDAAVHCASVSAARRICNGHSSSELVERHNRMRTMSMPSRGSEQQEELPNGSLSRRQSTPLPRHEQTVDDYREIGGDNGHSTVDVVDGRTGFVPSTPPCKRRHLFALSKRVRSLLDMLGTKQV